MSAIYRATLVWLKYRYVSVDGKARLFSKPSRQANCLIGSRGYGFWETLRMPF